MIMTLFKFFKKVEHIVLESAQASGLNLKISMLNPIHAKWVTQYYDHIRSDENIVKNGWRRSGIVKAIKENIHKEDPF